MFEGLANFRDFGGYPTADGRQVRRDLLYRSAHHGDLTDGDLKALAALDLATVVDLRRANERARTPSRRWPGFACQVIDNDLGDEGDPWLDFIRDTPVLTPALFRRHMIGYYADAPFEERHLDLFRRYFAALADGSGGVLIHCAAGKDRTGLLAALTQHLLGVPDTYIVHDYLLTNDQPGLAIRAPIIAGFVEAHTGRKVSNAAIMAGLVVETDHLQTAFDAIAAAHGSLDGYLVEALGVDARRRAAIRGRLVS